MNFILAVFNLAPGFPLDGGRIFRAIAWGITGDFNRATKLAAHAGQWVSYAMIGWGILQAVRGLLREYGWRLLDGLLASAARESLAHINMHGSLAGLRASDVMITDIPAVSGGMTLQEYALEVVRAGRRFNIVSVSGQIAGIVSLNAVQRMPRSEWGSTPVQAVMQPWGRIHWASLSVPLTKC